MKTRPTNDDPDDPDDASDGPDAIHHIPAEFRGSVRAESPNGARGIRTPEARRPTGFQDRRMDSQTPAISVLSTPPPGVRPTARTVDPESAPDSPDPTPPADPDLARLAAAWPELNSAIRAAIVVLAESHLTGRR